MPDRDLAASRAAFQHVTEAAFRRTLGSPALFSLVYTTVAAALYYALGVVAHNALGVTPFVFAAAAVFFVLAVLTYVEGASLHQERAGSTVFARYAFNELWSFVAGWAILLDYVILMAIAAITAANYLGAFWAPLAHGTVEAVVAIAIIVGVAVANVMGLTAERLKRLVSVAVVDLVLQITVVVLGLVLVFDLPTVLDPIDLGTSPTWRNVVFALTIAAAAACTGLEASSGLAGEVRISRRGLRRLVGARIGTVLFLYVGVSLVALAALPVTHGHTALGGRYEKAPLLGVVSAYEPGTSLPEVLRYAVGGVGALLLVIAANGAMLGLSRLSYSLATNRQIPSLVGRLHPKRSTPVVAIGIAAVLASVLVLPESLDFLLGVYAFGVMIAMTLAHLSVIVLRYREPDRDRPYRMPLSVRVRGGMLPLPAVLGAVLAAAGWVSTVVTHGPARYLGSAWMVGGLVLYVVYRRTEGKPIFKRVTVPATALAREPVDTEYGSILVPLLGTPLDDDIMQTAGRLAGDEEDEEGDGAVIEALWIFEVPMSLPIDAALPESRLQQARAALARAKAVGEEYEGVEVATATVRARRTGQAIVDEARRRGVEAIVLAAEEPSRIRGGALLGGRGGPLDNFVGDVTRYVVGKAPCRVILTAPPADAPVAATAPAIAETDAAER
ncbi:MAG: basic amino acid/polyamine antiporter, family [Solirubrobacteraceae bacterium]|nr:basic amino acid/polyamine antiporter, family [Solirubrobacteraceae bacterium]